MAHFLIFFFLLRRRVYEHDPTNRWSVPNKRFGTRPNLPPCETRWTHARFTPLSLNQASIMEPPTYGTPPRPPSPDRINDEGLIIQVQAIRKMEKAQEDLFVEQAFEYFIDNGGRIGWLMQYFEKHGYRHRAKGAVIVLRQPESARRDWHGPGSNA